ncbi:SusC/RagA family TonB-linked outer membrane protein [Butyricimonas sp. Marseille-P3923]|uniref:SusC/RagA family TonB-linked outer membrane protein n=1 Tax=Butyricimonas sp. Marseille-P3923 TaxID=1987504 RepID=UPI002100499C|nr:SusC/RagA family TonB-linked outer membrane protein [Butyricimonas sp. Marseille-P3923]
MKKTENAGKCPREKLKHLMRLLNVLLLMTLLCMPSRGFSQEKRFTFEFKHVPVSTVYLHIEKNSDYSFVYNTQEIQRIGLKDYKFQNATIQEILDYCLKGTGLKYEIRDKHVIIRRVQEIRSQQDMRQIRGLVVGVDSIELPGVTVLLKGTSMGVTTDAKGYYSVWIPKQEDAVLIFSFVGMKTQEIPCKEKSVINLVMEEDVTAVEEVVVTGYQTMRKSDVVGSVTTVKASDIMMPSYTSIDQMLQGRVAGMMVTNTSSRVGTSPKIRVRGTSTLLGNQDPLWVVDGIIQPDPISINTSDAMVDDLKNILGNQISWLNPADIETITVLKDAAATAIYGSKAANGVIVITTKKGEKGRLTVNYGCTFTFRAQPNYAQFNLMNSEERIQFSKEAFDQGALYTQVPPASINTYEGIMRMLYDKQITTVDAEVAVKKLASLNTNWFEILTRNSFSHNHNLSMSGGTEKVTYNVSLGYNDQAGVEVKNDVKNLSGRMNLGVQLHPKLRVDVILSGVINKNLGYAAEVNPIGYAQSTSRAVPAYDDNGDLYYQDKGASYKLNNRDALYLKYNILNEIDHSYSKNRTSSINGSLNFSWDIFPWLKYEFVGGINNSNKNAESYAGAQTYYIAKEYRGYDYGTEEYGSEKYNAAMLPYGGELYNKNDEITGWNIQNKVTVQKTFAEKHRINILLGTESSSSLTKNRSYKTFGYSAERGESVTQPTPIEKLEAIGYNPTRDWGILNVLYNGRGWGRVSQMSNQFSVFATLAYSFMNRYVFNFSMRNDASNRFGQDQNKRFDPTYSFGLSWNVARESWLESISSVLNQFLLRVSYGIQGNAVNSVSPELILKMGETKEYYGSFTSTVSRLPNPDLSWERTKTWNLGVDVQLLQWITMTLEYYRKRSNNIVSQDIALEYGRSSMEINGGRMTNSGVEYTLNVTPVRTKDWAWTIGLNSSKNWNKAKTQSIDVFSYHDYLQGSSTKVLKKGYALSSIWSFSYKGLNHDTGMPEFNLIYEQDGNGEYIKDDDGNLILRTVSEITDFLVYSGKTEPDFTGGLTTRLRWKGLTFGANFSLILGAKKRLPNPFPAGQRIPTSDVNLDKELLKRWKHPGDELTTSIPSVYTGKTEEYITLPDKGSAGFGTPVDPYSMWQNSDLRVVRADFLRCQQMSLSWNIDGTWCARWGIKSMSLNATMNNLFVLASKKFHGFDPELGNSIQPKTYSLGVNIGF